MFLNVSNISFFFFFSLFVFSLLLKLSHKARSFLWWVWSHEVGQKGHCGETCYEILERIAGLRLGWHVPSWARKRGQWGSLQSLQQSLSVDRLQGVFGISWRPKIDDPRDILMEEVKGLHMFVMFLLEIRSINPFNQKPRIPDAFQCPMFGRWAVAYTRRRAVANKPMR